MASLTELFCFNNNLSNLNLVGTTNLSSLNCTINPLLSCIQVSNVNQAESKKNWFKEDNAIYLLNCTTGLEENNNNLAVQIFPNPTNGVFTLQNASGTISIQNIMGELVFSTLINSTNETINISSLANGVYFVNVNGKVIKLVKE